MAAIVVGYDGSACARAALDEAIALARDLSLDLVIGYGSAPPGGVGEEYTVHAEAIEERADELTRAALQHVRDQGLDASVEIVRTAPATALVELGDRHDARFIVIGSSGQGPIRRAILGSTANRLVRATTRPVVLVPAPAA